MQFKIKKWLAPFKSRENSKSNLKKIKSTIAYQYFFITRLHEKRTKEPNEREDVTEKMLKILPSWLFFVKTKVFESSWPFSKVTRMQKNQSFQKPESSSLHSSTYSYNYPFKKLIMLPQRYFCIQNINLIPKTYIKG